MKIAVLGANGFVGARAVEYFTLTQKAEVRCLVRSFSGLARCSRFEADWRIADLADESRLAAALRGCDVLFHTVAGDHDAVARSMPVAYRAAATAGVRRIVFLSSAAVFENLDTPMVDEATPVPTQRRSAYAAAKLAAERLLLCFARRGPVEASILRPSIITGPRSLWIAEPGRQLLAGRFDLVEGGPGVCNSIYVDNLLDAVLLAAQHPAAAGQIFLVADENCVSWGDFYRGLARALGRPPESVQSIPRSGAQPPSRRALWLRRFRFSSPYQIAGLLLPKSLKQSLKWRLQPASSRWPVVAEHIPHGASYEQTVLQLSPWRITTEKARRLLDYQPAVTIDEGLRRSAAWLEFAGWR